MKKKNIILSCSTCRQLPPPPCRPPPPCPPTNFWKTCRRDRRMSIKVSLSVPCKPIFFRANAKHCLPTQVKRRLALGSPGLVVRSFGCHHAENGRIHRKNVVDCPLVINSLGYNPFQTRPDQEWGKNWPGQPFA